MILTARKRKRYLWRVVLPWVVAVAGVVFVAVVSVWLGGRL